MYGDSTFAPAGTPRGDARHPSVAVLAPAPLLTVTVEPAVPDDEVHFHPGGQGVWIARLIAKLDVDVVLCASFGGESGMVVHGLVERLWGIRVRAVHSDGWNGVYIHDRRSGERDVVAETDTPRRSRHEVDELYGAVLAEGIEADVAVLGGPETARMARCDVPESIPLDVYRRLPSDLHRNGTTVVADLSGRFLDAAVEGGIDVLKVSDEEMLITGLVADRSTEAIIAAMDVLVDRGVDAVVVTCAEGPTLAHLGGARLKITAPEVSPIDDRGAGDSVTAGIAAALARGDALVDAVRVGAAAGALNVTRRGRGSGSRPEIEMLARHVAIEELR